MWKGTNREKRIAWKIVLFSVKRIKELGKDQAGLQWKRKSEKDVARFYPISSKIPSVGLEAISSPLMGFETKKKKKREKSGHPVGKISRAAKFFALKSYYPARIFFTVIQISKLNFKSG